MTERTLGIVIPAYQPDIELLDRYIEQINNRLDPATILVELDAPEPETALALRSLPVTVETVSHRRGKGTAITAGFETLETDLYMFADADGSTPVDSLADIVEPVRQHRAALAVGSRRHPDAEIEDEQSRLRQFLGDGFSWLAGSLLPVTLHDYQCGAKAIDAHAWNQVHEHLYEPGFAWDVELIAMVGALDLSITEVPVQWEDRPGSTVDPVADAARMFRALLTSRHRAKQLTDERFHSVIAARTTQPTPLIEEVSEL
ncbi:glycosyltransferase [Halonotius roseus]|uniref:Glycosyltransferase n=1 Tax=Halonotius roseus TaxID=2511997 RepID=A0A544QRM8_9EURY|nr:glycosyltransferase [Halonotius roseus]TQQ82082.1 glycosyltransferase [Halonotius roseus]